MKQKKNHFFFHGYNFLTKFRNFRKSLEYRQNVKIPKVAFIHIVTRKNETKYGDNKN